MHSLVGTMGNYETTLIWYPTTPTDISPRDNYTDYCNYGIPTTDTDSNFKVRPQNPGLKNYQNEKCRNLDNVLLFTTF